MYPFHKASVLLRVSDACDIGESHTCVHVLLLSDEDDAHEVVVTQPYIYTCFGELAKRFVAANIPSKRTEQGCFISEHWLVARITSVVFRIGVQVKIH